MAIFQVTSSNIQPGAERHGAAVDPPDRVTSAFIQLTDPNGVWNSTTGNITRWGVQASRADGTYANTAADWDNLGSQSESNVPFGSRDRSGGMPSMRMQGFGLVVDGDGNIVSEFPLPIAPAGVKLRLAIQVDHAIVLGATVKTNTDAD